MQAAPTVAGPDYDAHGNYANNGDLHRSGEKFDDLIPRMLEHLHATFPEYRFAPERKVYSGGRSLTMNVVSGPKGLEARDAAEDFLRRVKAEMDRFDRSQGNVYSDYHSSSFLCFAEIDRRYHAQHAEIVAGTEVASTMTLSAFKKAMKVGDRIVLESSNQAYSQGMIGVEREVIEARSGDFITHSQGGRKIYFDYPKAAAFACDGTRFRISDARAEQPDGYRLYRWIRA